VADVQPADARIARHAADLHVADAEGDEAASDVAVGGRQHLPVGGVQPVGQGRQRGDEDVRIARVRCADVRRDEDPIGIEQVDPGEGRIDRLAEHEAQLGGRLAHHLACPGAAADQLGVGLSRAGEGEARQHGQCQTQKDAPHGGPQAGRRRGARASPSAKSPDSSPSPRGPAPAASGRRFGRRVGHRRRAHQSAETGPGTGRRWPLPPR
jgi:hypothetical protein